MNNCENCIEGRPRIGRLAGVTRTMRLAIFEGEGVPEGTPQDLTGLTVVVRVLHDGTDDIYVPDFVVEGTDNNVIKFAWPATRQAVGNYTIDVTLTDGSDNVNRVDWHGPTGIRLVEHSYQVYGDDATGAESSEAVGLVGYYTTNGVGMSAFDEWCGSDESAGYPQTVAGFMEYLQQPATDAAASATATMTEIQSRADEDHRVAVADHGTAGSDHAQAGNDHTRAEGDHTTAADDHRIAAADHSTAGDDHTLAAADHVTAAADHVTAGNDHTRAESDHGTAASDHTQAGQDHTRANTDHGTAASDHTTAGSDHTRAESDHGIAAADHTTAGTDHSTAAGDHTTAVADHGIAAADHTQAVADHAVMSGYDTRLTNVETDVTQLGQEVDEKTVSLITPDATYNNAGLLKASGFTITTSGAVVNEYKLPESGFIYASGRQVTNDTRTAIAYYDEGGEFLGSEKDGGVSSAVNFVRYKLTIPTGAVTVRVVGSGNAQLPELYAFAGDIASDAYDAEQVVAGEEVEIVDLLKEQQETGYINSSSKWVGSGKCVLIDLSGVQEVRVDTAYLDGNGIIAFLQSDTIVAGETAVFTIAAASRITLTESRKTYIFRRPGEARFLYVQTASSTGTDIRSRYAQVGLIRRKPVSFTERTITPEIEIGDMSTSGMDTVASFDGYKYWRSSRYAKVDSSLDTINISVQTDGDVVRLYYYDSQFNFINFHNLSVSESMVDSIPAGTQYIRFRVSDTQGAGISRPIISLSGCFAEDWDIFLERPSTGSMSILVPVLISSPNTDDADTSTLQDVQTLLSDTGVLALPEMYSTDGEPTRLIIYCHGAGVNYAIGTGTFPSTDLKPEYWLAEGYAVMDVEGNPYNDVDEHVYIPAARQSYIAAYNYVIRKYNIRRDGILLGGRSMGGGMCFDLLCSPIPIIAACPVVPAINTMWWWEYMNASRRQFVAEKMGFVGTAPTWTTGSPMSADEWQYLQDNYDKFIKYSPFFAVMADTPTKEEIFSIGNTAASSANQTETELYAHRHIKVKAPVKMFAVLDDSTVKNSRNCALVYRMLLNAGQIAEMRWFQTGGHHYELASQNLLSSYTTQYGETLADVPITYVEMLAFWRRYEQVNP